MSDAENTTPAGDSKQDNAADEEAKKKLDKLKAENERLAAKAKAADEADAKRKADEEAARRKAKADEGKAKETLAELEAKHQAVLEENKRLMAGLIARAESRLAALPDEEKARLAGYKEKVTPEVWMSMVDDSAVIFVKQSGGSAPPPPGGDGQAGHVRNEYKPSEDAKKFLEDNLFGAAIKHLERAELVKDKESGAMKFTKKVANFLGDMNRHPVYNFATTSEKDRQK